MTPAATCLLKRAPAVAPRAATFTVAIKVLPPGSRVVAVNPTPEEFDDTWPEPEQVSWVTLALTLTKADGTPVRAEFLRPRAWVDRMGIRVGEALPIAVSELYVDGEAVVTGITPCPPIASGEGRVVTGRFVTRSAGNVVLVCLANGTEIRATDVHPVWSVDREEWVPAGELQPDEQVDTLAGPVAVLSVERLESALDVYNIEVHGEHVFRVTADGVLVHNACDHHLVSYFANTTRGWVQNWSQLAQGILRNADIGLHSQLNRVLLLIHKGPHPELYHQRVYERLEIAVRGLTPHTDAYTKAVRDELAEIAKLLQASNGLLNGIGL
jgi:hypothetical protein